MEEPVTRHGYVDALRGLAILAVLVNHCGPNGVEPYPDFFSRLVFEGMRGVQLFYIVSAFTLFYSMDARQGRGEGSLAAFFLRRFFRIAPLFYSAMLYYLWQDGFGPRYASGDQPGITAAQVLATFTFTFGANPYWMNSIVPGGWSIAVEMPFYLTVPFLFRRIKDLKSALWLLVGASILCQFLVHCLARTALVTDERLWSEYLYFFLPSQFPVFVLGIVLYLVVAKGREMPLAMLLEGCSPPLLVLAALAIGHLVLGGLLPYHLLFGFGLCLLSYSLHLRPLSFLVNPLTELLGRLSYSMYLTHPAVMHFMKSRGMIHFVDGNPIADFLVRFAVVTALTLLISSATYALIERPGQSLGRRFIAGRKRQPDFQKD